MNPVWPLIITVALSVCHVLGGGALGMGLRMSRRGGAEKTNFFILWGAGMGVLPLIVDWAFLILPGNWLYGMVGPILLILTTAAGAFLRLKLDIPAIISAVIGSAWCLLGILVIPLMLDAARAGKFKTEDYFFSAFFVLFSLFVGSVFARNGFAALLRGISLDQQYSEQMEKLNKRQKDKKD